MWSVSASVWRSSGDDEDGEFVSVERSVVSMDEVDEDRDEAPAKAILERRCVWVCSERGKGEEICGCECE